MPRNPRWSPGLAWIASTGDVFTRGTHRQGGQGRPQAARRGSVDGPVYRRRHHGLGSRPGLPAWVLPVDSRPHLPLVLHGEPPGQSRPVEVGSWSGHRPSPSRALRPCVPSRAVRSDWTRRVRAVAWDARCRAGRVSGWSRGGDRGGRVRRGMGRAGPARPRLPRLGVCPRCGRRGESGVPRVMPGVAVRASDPSSRGSR